MARCFAFFTLFHSRLTYFLTGLALENMISLGISGVISYAHAQNALTQSK